MRTKTIRVNSNTRVCSKHFVGGKKGPLDVPTIFPFSNRPKPRPITKRRTLEHGTGDEAEEKTDCPDDTDGADQSTPGECDGGEVADQESVEESPPVAENNEAENPVSAAGTVTELMRQVMDLTIRLLEKEEKEQELREELGAAQSKAAKQGSQQPCSRFSFSSIQNDDDLVRFYTGLPSAQAFQCLYCSLDEYFSAGLIRSGSTWDGEGDRPGGNKVQSIISLRDQLFLTLIRLRLGAPLADLANRFQVHQSTVSRIFNTMVDLLYRFFETIKDELWPSRRVIDENMPEEFRRMYPSTRCVIDCTELPIEKPTDPILQRVTWSSYKNRNTLKALVAITPDGCLSFVSELYGGSVSDREITQTCGFLEKLEPGDSVMADKGFTIGDLLEGKGVSLNIPPFLSKKDQLSAAEVVKTRRIAKLRIHVERQMERIKNYKMLDFLPITLCDVSNKLFCVCAWLTLFQPPPCP